MSARYRRKNRLQHQTRRRHTLESLEDRRLFAGLNDLVSVAEAASPESALVHFDLEVTNQQGESVSTAEPGEELLLNVHVKDNRMFNAQGAFSAYVDVIMSELASPSGDVIFGSDYQNGQSGVVSDDGVDELGGFATGFAPAGVELLLAQIPFKALAEGEATFATNPADEVPAHETLLFGTNSAVLHSQIYFDSVTLSIESDPPVAADDELAAVEDQSLVFTSDSLLENDSDPAGRTLAVKLASQPQHGTLQQTSGEGFRYIPNPDYFGNDEFQYWAANSSGSRSELATVRISVQAVNDAPDAMEDLYRVGRNNTLHASGDNGVLSNDTDVDSTQLTTRLGTEATNGQVTMAADGTFSYTPKADFVGTDLFTYYASDGENEIESTVTLNVFPPAVDVFVQFTDVNGNAITSVPVGQKFYAEILVQDQGDDTQGVFSAFVDMEFDTSHVRVAGDIQVGQDFPHVQSGDRAESGRLEAIGGTSGLTPTGDARLVLARIPMTADTLGVASFTTDAAEQMGQEFLVYGRDDALDATEIGFGSAQIEVVPNWHNTANPHDVNGDNAVSPIDALLVINYLNANGSSSLPGSNSNGKMIDVNNDGSASPIDALRVINHLNQPARRAVNPVETSNDLSMVAGSIIGMELEPAREYVKEKGGILRVWSVDGEPLAVTKENRFDRINVSVESGIVVKAVAEGNSVNYWSDLLQDDSEETNYTL